MKTSDFGKGLCYCLGLFLAHSERDYNTEAMSKYMREILNKPDIWFNGAADHLFELVIPDNLPKDLKRRLTVLKKRCVGWRITIGEDIPPTEEDKIWAINEAKELLLMIDRWLGIKALEAEWS